MHKYFLRVTCSSKSQVRSNLITQENTSTFENTQVSKAQNMYQCTSNEKVSTWKSKYNSFKFHPSQIFLQLRTAKFHLKSNDSKGAQNHVIDQQDHEALVALALAVS